jgi:outer membrane protein TolC
MKRRFRIPIYVVILHLLLSGMAFAQEHPPLRLTLREAVQMGLRQNSQIQVANLNVAQSVQDGAAARAGLLPQANLLGFESVQRKNLEAFIGTRIPGQPQHVGPFQTFQAGPQFSFPVFDLTLWRKWQASRHGIRAIEAQELSVREQTVLLVVSQYLGGLRAAANVREAQSRAKLAEALYDQAVELQKEGVGTGLDTLRANVQLQNEKQRLIVAKTQQEISLYGLARLLNLDPQVRLELADEMSFSETAQSDIAGSLELALANRPEVKSLESREQMMRSQKRAASEARLPRVNLGGEWAYQGVSASTAIPSYRYQFSVDLPLFTGGRLRAERVKAEIELKKSAREIEELRSQIALEVKTSSAQLESARNEVDVANLGLTLARQEVEQAREKFLAGVANNIEVISAQDALARANDNQIDALYRYNQARADLARATGRVEKLYTP